MSEQFSICKCSVCGNIIERLRIGTGELSCCGVPMQHMAANSADASKEKHVPVLEAVPGGCRVTVGLVPHVMEEKHWIEWIEITAACGLRCKKYLHPGEAPEANFPIPADKVTSVREYCNLHGLWKRD